MLTAYEYAIKYLYRYPKTERDLKIKMYQRGYSGEDVEKAIQWLKKQWFVDDVMFAEGYIRSDVVKKGKPALLVKKKLEMKGIDRKILDEAFAKFADDMQEGIEDKIKREIQGQKKRGVEGFDIIQKLMKKWYKLDDIKRVINNR